VTDERNINRGAIWGNKKKTKETHPDFTGSINVGGIEYWLDGWKRPEGANVSQPSMKFSVRPKEGQQLGKPHEDSAKTIDRFKQQGTVTYDGPARQGTQALLNDDIPFAPEVR
jgi:hypothetical protein